MLAFLRSILFNRYGTFKWTLFGSVFETGMNGRGEFLTPFPRQVAGFLGNRGFAVDFLPFRDYLNRDKLDASSPSYDCSYKFHSVI